MTNAEHLQKAVDYLDAHVYPCHGIVSFYDPATKGALVVSEAQAAELGARLSGDPYPPNQVYARWALDYGFPTITPSAFVDSLSIEDLSDTVSLWARAIRLRDPHTVAVIDVMDSLIQLEIDSRREGAQ